MADELLEMINGFKPGYELKYNKFYIGLARGGQPNNFAIFKPQKQELRLEFKLDQSEEVEKEMQDNEMDTLGYDSRWGAYRVRLSKGEIKKKADFLRSILIQAEERYRA